MFQDNPKAMEAVGQALKNIAKTVYNDAPLSTVWMIPFAQELMKHMDENDECSVVIRVSKEHGLQMSYSGCTYHAALLAALMQVRQSKLCSQIHHGNNFPIKERAAIGLLACEMAILIDDLIEAKPPEATGKESSHGEKP